MEQSARKNVPAALRNYSSEVERITLLLEGQDLDSREAIMAPPRFQCLNAVRPVLRKGLGLRAAFSTSRTTRAGLSTFFSKQQQVLTQHRRPSPALLSSRRPPLPRRCSGCSQISFHEPYPIYQDEDPTNGKQQRQRRRQPTPARLRTQRTRETSWLHSPLLQRRR